MKTRILFLFALILGTSLFASCKDSDKDNKEVTVTYRFYVGLGINSRTGTEAPAITRLENGVYALVNALNNEISNITVTGKAETIEGVQANAKQKAIAAYDAKKEAIHAKMLLIKTAFEANCETNAAAILAESSRYYVILKLKLLLEDDDDMGTTIKEEGEGMYDMVAIGGEDYSAATIDPAK